MRWKIPQPECGSEYFYYFSQRRCLITLKFLQQALTPLVSLRIGVILSDDHSFWVLELIQYWKLLGTGNSTEPLPRSVSELQQRFMSLETHEHQGIPRIFSMTKSTHDAARHDASASWIKHCHWIIYQKLVNQKRKLCQAEGKTTVPLFCFRMSKKLGSWPIFGGSSHVWRGSIENNQFGNRSVVDSYSIQIPETCGAELRFVWNRQQSKIIFLNGLLENLPCTSRHAFYSLTQWLTCHSKQWFSRCSLSCLPSL